MVKKRYEIEEWQWIILDYLNGLVDYRKVHEPVEINVEGSVNVVHPINGAIRWSLEKI